MERTRIALTVMVNLDPTGYGTMGTSEQAEKDINAILLSTIGHYEPVVVLNEETI